MSQLAIIGHAIRGKEVIEILEMLGGKNVHGIDGCCEHYIHYICKECNNEIHTAIITTDKAVFTLKEFLEKFPYKIGDKVIDIKTDKIVEIYGIHWSELNNCVYYDVKCLDNTCRVRSYKFLKSYKKKTMEERENLIIVNNEYNQLKVNSLRDDKLQLIINDKYELKQESDAYYIVRKEIQYPKTYDECCGVLLRTSPIIDDVEGYKWKLIMNFQKLLIYRDAYWKIAGEQMGLGKSWNPDWCDKDKLKYCIEFHGGVVEVKAVSFVCHRLLAFPTEEMRDAFYKNFKELIEKCKELL